MEAYFYNFLRITTMIAALHASLKTGDLSILTITKRDRSATTVIQPPP